ncbi:methyltransferase [Nesterenkonia sp. MY13]|uniref:Methyltransferase n=1 Tax=Nesterenkonia sedimenti TaxID=1463632 RepID=A0A7X8YEX9_9MICC|nr:methyltransferase [Nesterenkonia sedimenti]NLS10960.1 methyltransferase [Nesterenkonia sedimenti]
MKDAHYFRSPEGPFERREISVELAGRQTTVSTAGGIFSPDGVDKGTQVLLREVPAPASGGDLLDIGCGWGPIALTMAVQSPQATVWAVDVNERSRVLCAENAQRLGLENIRVCAPEEVPGGIQFATIWSNPPIRIGKQALHELLELWLPRLQQPQTGEDPAEAWLVVQKNLGADSLLTWMKSMLAVVGDDFAAERAASSKGFRMLRVTREQVQA